MYCVSENRAKVLYIENYIKIVFYYYLTIIFILTHWNNNKILKRIWSNKWKHHGDEAVKTIFFFPVHILSPAYFGLCS